MSKRSSSRLIRLGIIFAVVLVLEILVFNYRSLVTSGYKPVTPSDVSAGRGLRISGDEAEVISDTDKYIEINDINEKVHNIYLDISDTRANENEGKKGSSFERQNLKIILKLTDEANSEYFDTPDYRIIEGVERTKYIKLHTAGKTEKLRIELQKAVGDKLKIRNITLNAKVPFKFSFLRLIFTFFALFSLYCLRPGSSVYAIKYKGKAWQNATIAAFMAVNIAITSVAVLNNNQFISPGWDHHNQYNKLAEAFIKGQSYLDYTVPDSLKEMENPYDKKARDAMTEKTGEGYKWDTAYYNGKYYVYFGALPALLYYMPYKDNHNNKDLSNHVPVLINCYIIIVFTFLLSLSILKQKFPDTPFSVYLLLTQTMLSASGIIFMMHRPDLYNVPISMGVALTVAGLYMWISAYDTKYDYITKGKLCLGSLLMALVSASRPQLLMASFLAIPLFWNKTLKERKLFSKKYILDSVLFTVPYVIVAVLVMRYNFIRFGSVFDFGANYNLTTNDMTRRGFDLGRIPMGIGAYLLQPPKTMLKFPFINGTELWSNYMGMTISETMYGGVFGIFPISWLLLKLSEKNIREKIKGLLPFCVCSICFAVVIAVADTQMAGILYRYMSDFSLLILIPAIIMGFALSEKGNVYVNIASLLTLFMCVCLLFNTADFSLESTNPNFYYSISTLITFWM